MKVQDSLNQLEDMIMTSRRVLWSYSLVNENSLLDQVDEIRLNLPAALEEAERLLQQREEIVQEANHYAREIVTKAERRAQQLLDESVILRQAETRASQILYRTQQEQEALRQKTRQEVLQLQRDADVYVDRVLQELEQRLLDSLQVVRQGRQQVSP
ncbi:MAG: ATP synthase F0 subunit B [Synechococcaceae cyanobacterium SM2_3_2]|nr:ATP synthase F0 subunit B [Synechococcaceae cyanobacterium SM2_3_2]